MADATRTDDGDSVTLPGAVSIGIGGMVGGGIFAVLGVAAEEAGGATPLAFLVAGVVAGLTAYCYSKLSVRHPSPGGTVTFIDQVFGVGTLTASVNVVLWAGYIATTGLYAAAFGHYAATLMPGDLDTTPLAFKSLAVVGVVVPWFVNLTNAALITRTEGAVVAVKMTILLLVIAAGVPAVESDRLGTATWPSIVTVVAAGMLVFVAYEGFELISNASADIAQGRRNLPRAYALSVGIVVVVYVLIAAVVVGSLSSSEISVAADFALAEAASTTLGRAGFVLVAVSAVLATFSAINATLYGAARLSFTLATIGELPPGFRRRPWHQPIGLHATAAIGLAIAVGLPLASISGICSLVFLIVFAVVDAAAFRSGADARVARPIALAGLICASTSFAVLLVQSVRNDLPAVVVFVALVAVALVAEHAVLARRRPA